MLSKSREDFLRERISNEAAWARNELIRNQEIGSRSCQIKRVRNREAGTCSIPNVLALVVQWLACRVLLSEELDVDLFEAGKKSKSDFALSIPA